MLKSGVLTNRGCSIAEEFYKGTNMFRNYQARSKNTRSFQSLMQRKVCLVSSYSKVNSYTNCEALRDSGNGNS